VALRGFPGVRYKGRRGVWVFPLPLGIPSQSMRKKRHSQGPALPLLPRLAFRRQQQSEHQEQQQPRHLGQQSQHQHHKWQADQPRHLQ